MKAVDVMGFAGSMACGVDQAGFDVIAKREPAKFGGFGVESHVYNMPWLDAQVSAPEQWDLPQDRDIDLVFGCPPCSGFSALSAVNVKVYEHTGTTYRGEGAEINECMEWLVDYAARVRPQVVILESVGPAFKIGRGWMESLWQRLRAGSGLDYHLTHVNMNAALVGGDVVRPRYFLVAHLAPFGVGMEFVTPRPMIEVIGDLSAESDFSDTDWGHHIQDSGGPQRVAQTIRWLESQGREWAQGTRLPDNLTPEELAVPADPTLVPEWWWKARPPQKPGKRAFDSRVYSHWYSTDPFSPFRWREDKPFGVVVAATLDRAVHPTAPRTVTYREAARFMSLPDTWSMRVLGEKRRSDELGKAVPTASAKWVAHWARMAIEGTPGEYAGVQDTDDARIHVITVNSQRAVQEALNDPDGLWFEQASDPDPALWLVDRKQRPDEWWQREDEAGVFAAKPAPERSRRMPKIAATEPARAPQKAQRTTPTVTIERVPPETVIAFLESVNLTKAEAAAKLGVSSSRIHELTSHVRPKSWLAADRWAHVQEVLSR